VNLILLGNQWLVLSWWTRVWHACWVWNCMQRVMYLSLWALTNICCQNMGEIIGLAETKFTQWSYTKHNKININIFSMIWHKTYIQNRPKASPPNRYTVSPYGFAINMKKSITMDVKYFSVKHFVPILPVWWCFYTKHQADHERAM